MTRFRLSAMYGALFLLFGVQLPYLPVWLDWKGLGADDIAVVLAVPMVLRIVFMPMVGVWADHVGDVVGVARGLALGAFGFAMSLALGFVDGWVGLLVVGLLLLAPSLNPLTETMTLGAVREGICDYGKVRLWGSLTFIVANLGAGIVIDRAGAGSVAWMMAFGAGLTVLSLFLLPRQVDQGGARGGGFGRLGMGSFKRLLGQRSFVLLLVTAGLLQASHAVFYVYGVLHWQSLGYSTTLTGMLWAIGVVAEIYLFQVARRVLSVVGAIGLIAIGGAAGVVRWGIMGFDPWFSVLVVLQAAHALTYAATHTVTMHLMARIVPNELAGSAQALLAAFTASVAMSGAVLLAGLLYPVVGAGSYLAMAVMSGAGVIGAVWLRREVAAEQNY